MKKLIYYTLLFLSFQMYGQDSWNIILLEGTSCPECRHRKMIQTNDGGFIVIIGTADDGSAGFPKAQHWLRKYDGTGELLWDKRYDFGVTTPGPNGWGGASANKNLLELDNGDLVMNGIYTEGDTSLCYFFRTDAYGDSLVLKMYANEDCYGQLSLYNEEIYAMRTDDLTSEKSILRISMNGAITIAATLEESDISKYKINDNFILTVRSTFQTKFRKFDFNGNLVTDYFFDQNYGKLILPNETGGITGYSEGLIKLDANLSEIWHTPIDDLFVGGVGTINMYGEAIAATPDGGYILAGHSEPFIDEQLVYLVKVDENGVREWGGLYSSWDIGLNFIFDIEPVSDGYVFTGGNTGTETIWLVKVDEMGIFTETEEVEAPKEELLVFPNPASSIVNMRWPEFVTGRLQLYNAAGVLLQEQYLNQNKEAYFSVSDLPTGLYFIHLLDEKTGLVSRNRFMKI